MSGTATLSPLILEHSVIHKVVQGVYVAQPKAGGAAASNAGIVALGSQTLIFDTFWLPTAADELRRAAEDLTNAPVSLVVNSHHHSNHIGGNQVFDADATIIASTVTRELIADRAPQQLAWHHHHHRSHLAQLEASYLNAKGKAKQTAQEAYNQYQLLISALPEMAVRLPNMTFEQKMVLHGANRRIEIISYGGGHTSSDTIIHLPDDGIIFMGDLLSTKRHPFLGDGDPGELPRILDLITRLNPIAIIPGHGDIGTVDDIQTLQTYLAVLTETALTELAFQYEDEDEISHKVAKFTAPNHYQEWANPENFNANLRFLYQRVMTAYAD